MATEFTGETSEVLQGLKPSHSLVFCGTTEVVP
jgi:hypothetical protein